jgi:beta-xylosidase
MGASAFSHLTGKAGPLIFARRRSFRQCDRPRVAARSEAMLDRKSTVRRPVIYTAEPTLFDLPILSQWHDIGQVRSLGHNWKSPAYVGRRQEHLSCRVSTKLFFDPKNQSEEAGIVLRGDERQHYKIAVGFYQGERVVAYRWVRNRKVYKEVKFEAPADFDWLECKVIEK